MPIQIECEKNGFLNENNFREVPFFYIFIKEFVPKKLHDSMYGFVEKPAKFFNKIVNRIKGTF